MNRQYRLRPQVYDDLLHHSAYIGQHSSDAADRFFDSFWDSLDQLLHMPLMGRELELENPRVAGLRRWFLPGFERYLVLYFFHDDTVEVVRLIHGAQDLPALLDEQPL